jgi:protein-S-isoprenylcysteine O-methyltransferase Ste14
MHILPTITTGLDGLFCFSAFCWGVKGHFRQTGAMPPGMKLTSALSAAGFAWFVWQLAHGAAATWPLTLALFTGSLAVFVWAIAASRQTPPTLAFDTDQPSFIIHRGAYRYVRHPFYLSYILFWIGTALASHGISGWAVPAVMTALYFHAATREERKFAVSELREAYAAYRRQAGMFLPRLVG